MDLLNRTAEFLGLPKKGTGALVDTRPRAEKEKDYFFGEVVASANPVEWREKKESEWRSFPIFNQNGSGSCVAQTMAKMLGVMIWLKEKTYVHFSATDIYQRRANKPDGGMGGDDVFKIARRGVTLEALAPSQSMTDEAMDAYAIESYKRQVGDIFKIGNSVVLPLRDIDTVASVIQTTKKAVMVWFYFQRDEWTDRPIIRNSVLSLTGAKTLRHSVTAVDFTLVNGEKALIIEDSWGPNYGIGGRRVITESFFKERNFYAAYATSFTFAPEADIVLPAMQFEKDLAFIPWDTIKDAPADKVKHEAQKADVVKLQNVLKKLGTFPADRDATGYFGAITCKAVKLFQEKYAVATPQEILEQQGKFVGPKTRAKLNELTKA